MALKKADVLAAIASKFTAHDNPANRRTETIDSLGKQVAFYEVRTYDLAGDVLQTGSVQFWVLDEGQTSELAGWLGREPKPVSQGSFHQRVIDEIDRRIASAEIQAAFVRDLDPQNNRATVAAINADDTRSDYLLVETSLGVFDISKIL